MKKLIRKIENQFIVTQVPDDYKFQSEFETFDDLSGFEIPDIVCNVGVESATKEEIEAYNQQIETAQKKIEMETLLKSGIVVDNFWFNEYYLAQFISLIGVCERENKQIEWKNTNDNWETLSVSDANKIAFNASIKFQQIYKNT